MSSTRGRIRGVVPEQRRVSGPAKLLRGILAAVVAVGSAALAHTVAGHYAPHGLVILLALAVSIPVCVQLAGVQLSRRRLAAAVLSSQVVLHGLFALLPASAAVSSGLPQGLHSHHGTAVSHSSGGGSASAGPSSAGIEAYTVLQDPAHGIAAQTDTAMIAAHIIAAVSAYLLLRRGETLLHAVASRLGIAPVLVLLEAQSVPHAETNRIMPAIRVLITQDVWPGSGPRSLRGPPLLVK